MKVTANSSHSSNQHTDCSICCRCCSSSRHQQEHHVRCTSHINNTNTLVMNHSRQQRTMNSLMAVAFINAVQRTCDCFAVVNVSRLSRLLQWPVRIIMGLEHTHSNYSVQLHSAPAQAAPGKLLLLYPWTASTKTDQSRHYHQFPTSLLTTNQDTSH